MIFKLYFKYFMDFNFKGIQPDIFIPQRSRRKLTNWLKMVARAAPETPILNLKIKRGSRKIFKIPPEVIPIMA